ncbi:hypothetical protein OEZ85_004369 [Tetradesmus obliquus]|uniref:Tyr recombinase domain-containing protein n=1 Tax=Tetradesmus obliquus TaxID=3088 RepID=A0ABY8UL90_TETOB|nr:hypothetical protein OEZ85_004369 [Tetradesmus obliquus]
MTPALSLLQGEVVSLQVGALAESMRRKYEAYELYWSAECSHTVVVAGRRGHALDPVAWWLDYITRVPAPPTAAAFGYYVEGEYVPLVHTEFVRWVKSLLSRAGVDSSKYSGHSFRRGAATFSLMAGIPGVMIKELGAWKSQVYQVYLDLSLSQKLSVHARWFDCMAAGQLGEEFVSGA